MLFPDYRPRRLRQNENFRRMVRETRLSVDDLILPLFAVEGKGVKNAIPSMPGHYQLSADHIVKEVKMARDLGIPAVMLFGIPNKKDAMGTGAYAKNGIVQKTVKRIKDKISDVVIITDVCLCEYTDHGHCGMVHDGINAKY
ncbi:MAG: porphobilinogen synthase, partial [Thermodesulfobacteriota bacterium]|nr:porphobilinogen synthase [Thermodesulfobacteriota bacterium]